MVAAPGLNKLAGVRMLRPESMQQPGLRGISHLGGFVAALPAGVLLVVSASPGSARVASLIYVSALVLLFGTSAAYHRLARTSRIRTLMRRLDHSAIYLLIAGSYVPVCIVALPPSWGIPMLSVVGAGAGLGVGLKFLARGRLQTTGYALYLVLGWVAIVSLPALARYLTASQFVLILAGGAAYTIGVIVLWRRWPDPWPRVFGYHEVWHGFTLLAAALHFAAIASLVQ